MTYNIRTVASEQEAEAMVAADSHDALAERIERMVTAGRHMVLALREFTYLGRPPVIYGGMRLTEGGFESHAKGDEVSCFAQLTNGSDRYDGSRWFGYSVRTFRYSGNETEDVAWQRYQDHKAVAEYHSDRRRNMTHVAFTGGLPGWKWQTSDRIVITDWNGDGVATEMTLGFEPGEGSW